MRSLERIQQEWIGRVAALRARGVSPYPYRLDRTHTTREAIDHFDELLEAATDVSLAERAMSIRRHGGTAFIDVIEKLSTSSKEADPNTRKGLVSGLLAAALILSIAFNKGAFIVSAQSPPAEPTSALIHKFFPSLWNGSSREDIATAATAPATALATSTGSPTGELKTSTPPPPEVTNTPEKPRWNFRPKDRIWVGDDPVDPYQRSGSFESEGMSTSLADEDGSGWIRGTREKAYSMIRGTDERVRVLRDTLSRAMGGDEKLPGADRVAEGEPEVVHVVLGEHVPFALTSLSGAPTPPLDVGEPPYPMEQLNIFGISYASYVILNPYAGMDDDAIAFAKLQEDDSGMTPVTGLPTTEMYLTGFGPGADFEVPRGEPFTLTVEINTAGEGAFIFGDWDRSDGSRGSQRVGLYVDGGKMYLFDTYPDATSSHIRYYILDATTSFGVINVRFQLNSSRDFVDIDITDAGGNVQSYDYALQGPLNDRGRYGTEVALPIDDFHIFMSGSAYVEFASDPERVADWVEGTDPNSERIGQITDQSESLKERLRHSRLVMPYPENAPIGFSMAGLNDVMHHGDYVLYDRSTVYRMQNGSTRIPLHEGQEFWFDRQGHQAYIREPFRDFVRDQQEAGNPEFRAVVKYDMRTTTTDQAEPATPSQVNDFWAAHLSAYDSDLFIDAGILFERDGTLSDAATRGLPAEARTRATNPVAFAAEFAKYLITHLPDGTNYEGAWIIDPKTSFGLSQAENIANAIEGANSVDGFNVDVLIPIVGEVDLVRLEGFMMGLRARDVVVGLIDPDSFIPIETAARLTRGTSETDPDGILVLTNPIDTTRPPRPETTMLQHRPDGLLELGPAFDALMDSTGD